ncbi:IS66-like element accessory protein TnpA [Castellaniella sp.]|uniref:IS66-like element accessory protein TnpA n=1 Tax=Castellaniella sp. TaxID=1955812 RepID=UPI003A8E837E
MDPDASTQRPARRKHSKALKAQILHACDQPGASVAGIAIAHGLNPNMVQRWRREVKRGELTLADTPAFIPVVATPAPAMLTPPSAPAAPLAIEVQLQRGALQARVSWPVQAAGECAAWLRELFR